MTHTFDLMNNELSMKDALNNETIYAYDNLYRVTSIETPDPDGTGPLLSPVTTFEYDVASQMTAWSDPLSRRTEYDYDALGRVVKETFPDPDGPMGPELVPVTEFTYDLMDNRLSVTDALDNVTQYFYDDLYRLTSIVDADPDGPLGPELNPTTNFEFDIADQLTAVSDPLNRRTEYVYDDLGRVTLEVYPDPDGPSGPDVSPEMTYSYDLMSNKLSSTDALNNTTTYAYDDLYRLRKLTEPDPDGPTGPELNRVTEFEYDIEFQMVSMTDPLARRTEYAYDNLGRMTRETRPDPDGPDGPQRSPVRTHVYDLMDNRTWSADALGNTTDFQYDNLYRTTAIIRADPDGPTGVQTRPTNSFAYDSADQLISISDPLNRKTQFEFDQLGRVVREVYPDPDGAGPLAAPEMLYSYDLVGNRTSMTDAVGNKSEYAFDNLYRLTTTTEADPDGAGPLLNPVTAYNYDIASQLTSVSDPLQRTTSFQYDDLGRRTRTIPPDPDAGGPLASPESSFTYDLMNNQLTATNPLGHVTELQYDDLYRVVAKMEEDLDGLGGSLGRPTTSYSYDLVDNVLSLTDPAGNRTTFAYDDLNRNTSETIELGMGNFQSRLYEYDLEDNLVRSTDRNERVIENDYDNIYRAVEERWLDDTNSVVNTIQFEFDEANQLLRAEDLTSGSRYDYVYDALSRVTRSTANNGGPSVVFAMNYDAQNRRTSEAAAIDGVADFVNTYIYDALNRLSQLDQTSQVGGATVAAKRFDFAYNADDQITQLLRHDALAGGTANVVLGTTYGYDGIGRLLDMVHSNGSSTVVDYDWTFDPASRITQFISSVDGTANYNYDDGDQLTGATHSGQTNETYTYDENGNRTLPGHTTSGYNRLASDGEFNYDYDDEGNRTRRTNVTTGEVTDYAWDHRNRLVSVTERATDGGAATQQVDNRYDVFNRWISEEVDADGDGPGSSKTTRYEYDGNQIVLVFDDSQAVTNRYSWGPAVDQLLADEQVGGQVLWPVADHLGTIRDWIDSSGSVANHITYDSYGNVSGQSNAAVDQLFGYTSRPFSNATGLQNNVNRWYDSATGSWISEDPIGFAANDASLYRYVGNSPIDYVDPLGFMEQGAGDFAKGFVQGLGTGMRKWVKDNAELLKIAKGALPTMLDAVGTTTLGLFGMAAPDWLGGRWALEQAQKAIVRNPSLQNVMAMTQGALDAMKKMTPKDAMDLATSIAEAAGGAAIDKLKNYKDLLDRGCKKQAGKVAGEIVGQFLPDILIGAATGGGALAAGAARRLGKEGLKSSRDALVKAIRKGSKELAEEIREKGLKEAAEKRGKKLIKKVGRYTSIDDFAAGREFASEAIKRKAWDVYQRAAKSKGIVIGFGDDVVKHGTKDGLDILAFSEEAIGITKSKVTGKSNPEDWWPINKAWLDGAIDADVPVKLVSRGDEVAEALEVALENGTNSGLTAEIRHLLMRGHTLSSPQ